MLFPDAPELNWKEKDLQRAVATFLNDLEDRGLLAWSHPPNEAKHKPQYRVKQLQAGMKTGEPDCMIFLPDGKTVFIELKRVKGSVSDAQKARHALLGRLGHVVHVIKAASPRRAVDAVKDVLKGVGVLA